MCCDINFEGMGLKFVEDLAKPFLNGFACSGAHKIHKIHKIRGYLIIKLVIQNTPG